MAPAGFWQRPTKIQIGHKFVRAHLGMIRSSHMTLNGNSPPHDCDRSNGGMSGSDNAHVQGMDEHFIRALLHAHRWVSSVDVKRGIANLPRRS